MIQIFLPHVQQETARARESTAVTVRLIHRVFVRSLAMGVLGEYGYAKFEEGETEARSYELEARRELFAGLHCLRFHYYLSDGASDATISVFLENVESNSSVTIATASSFSGNKWSEIRRNFQVSSTQSKVSRNFDLRFSPTDVSSLLDHLHLRAKDLRSIAILFWS